MDRFRFGIDNWMLVTHEALILNYIIVKLLMEKVCKVEIISDNEKTLSSLFQANESYILMQYEKDPIHIPYDNIGYCAI